MKQNFKVIASVMCVALSLVMLLIPVGALGGGEQTLRPLWDNTSTVEVEIEFQGYTGYAESLVRGKFGASSITTDIYVYRQSGSSWIYVTETHDTKEKFTSGVSCPFSASVGTSYRIDYTFTVTKDGVDEVINRTAYKTYTTYSPPSP